MAIYVIGDLHGCALQLRRLIKKISKTDKEFALWFTGDLVNRGPDSLQTLRDIRAMGARAVSVLGNHDLHLLAVSQGVRKAKEEDGLTEFFAAPDREDLLDWLRHRPLAHFDCGHLLVHAGVLPQWTKNKTLALAKEVESVLQSPNWGDFMRSMYGNQPNQWKDSLKGVDRLRCIVNALTRLRFCTEDGVMDFETASPPEMAPQGYMPWFDVPKRKTRKTDMVFGHWSTLGIVRKEHVFSLDSGCVWGGKLTAMRLDTREIFQEDCPSYRPIL